MEVVRLHLYEVKLKLLLPLDCSSICITLADKNVLAIQLGTPILKFRMCDSNLGTSNKLRNSVGKCNASFYNFEI